ncbi:NAD(P)H-dependent FMN reductase [Amycolatopsis marina]|uniref:NAD(P)H-dependent FMN reductase n=1 Tax=Amycolatopsis marina TaxID=490629 RepID=A0A1I1AB79_9PSEU|nr:NADPH-dependent FMN reductase [Amycolatopsis marina]SFB33778.1 NAD(P)H-dependent FMN reductase [Amycolatopsis marina]
MSTILTISGSLRRGSFNRRLLRALQHEHRHAEVEWTTWDSLGKLPPFDEDAERGPVPAAVADLRGAIGAADGLLIATPEYNGSVPGQLKNAIDWASRPSGAGVLKGIPAVVVGASPSQHGAAWAQADLRRVLGIAGADVVEGQLAVPEVFRQLDEHDRLLDDELRAGFETLLAELRAKMAGMRA